MVVVWAVEWSIRGHVLAGSSYAGVVVHEDAPPTHAAPLGEVAERLAADPARGLTGADAAARLAAHGPNELARGGGVDAARILLAQVTAPMILLLAGAGVPSAALGDLTEAVVIFVVVALNAWIGFRQEYRAEMAMAALQALATPTGACRPGRAPGGGPGSEVAPGDVVRLEPGARVPADGRIVEAYALRVEEAALTGESVPVDKRPAPSPRRRSPSARRWSTRGRAWSRGAARCS